MAASVIFGGLITRCVLQHAELRATINKGFAKLVSVIPSISGEPFSTGQAIHQKSRFTVIGDFPLGDKGADWATNGVYNCMRLCVHIALFLPKSTTKNMKTIPVDSRYE